jgi:UDP-N-acetylmuramate dehydrogenase
MAKPIRLIDRLPAVRGSLEEQAPLAPLTRFRVGGPAEILFRPEDAEDLAAFLAHRPADVPVTIIGVGSNLLVRDGGVPGVVIRLGRAFSEIRIDGTTIRAGGGALDPAVADAATRAGIAGLEFLIGVPGTIGGAVRMNAGAYGTELADVLVELWALDPSGQRHGLTRGDISFIYRGTSIPEGWIVLEAVLAGTSGDTSAIARRVAEIKASREATQPTSARTGGSTFANPPGGRAWELIERAGCRGLRRGGAQVSPMHCNFLINTGTATAADIEELGEEVRRQVRLTSGVELEWEIRRIGVPAGGAHG